jgi:hypothetical protein
VSILNHLAQAAAFILLLELLVVVMIFLAISGGLAFGSHWVLGKTDWAFGKVNPFVGIGRRYLRKGLDYAALPFIKGTGYAAQAVATARAIRERVRQLAAARRHALPPAPAAMASLAPSPVEPEPAEATSVGPVGQV